MASSEKPSCRWPIAVVLAAGLGACDKAPARNEPGGPSDRPVEFAAEGAPPPAAAGGFSGLSARLATIPAGYEVGEVSFSADGRHVAFTATKDGRSFLFLDGKPSRPYEAVRAPLFTAGRGGLVFVVRQGGKEQVVVDGLEGPRYDAIGTVGLGPDGRIVYSAQEGERWQVVVGARSVAAAGSPDPEPFVGAGGKRVVFTDRHRATRKASLRACSMDLMDCDQGALYDDIVAARTDPSGVLLAFLATKAGKVTAVTVRLDQRGLAGKLAGWYDDISHLAVSDGGQHLAFLATRGDRQVLVRDGAEMLAPRLDSPLELMVSRTGRVLLTSVVEGKVLALVDGKQVGKVQPGIDFPVFSPDGAGHAYATGDGTRSAVVVNGEEGPTFDKVVTPRFTPDGAKVVYRARMDGKRFAVVADLHGQTLRAHPHYQAVFDVAFSPDGKSVGYGVQAGQELWWKVEKL